MFKFVPITFLSLTFLFSSNFSYKETSIFQTNSKKLNRSTFKDFKVKNFGNSYQNIQTVKIKLPRRNKYDLDISKVLNNFGKGFDKNYGIDIFETDLKLKTNGSIKMFADLNVLLIKKDFIFAKNKKYYFKIEGIKTKSKKLFKGKKYKTNKIIKLTVLKPHKYTPKFINPRDIFNFI